MKTAEKTGSVRARPVCRVVQGWASLVGDGSAPSRGAWGASHVAACACCGEFFNRGDAWASALRREAVTDSAGATQASEGLDERIIAAVRRAAREEAQPKKVAGATWLFWAAGAAASVAGVLLFVSQAARVESSTGSGAPARAGVATNTDATNTDATEVWRRLQPEAIDLLGATPLQREADAFYSDARAALGFLALNFLPSSALKTPGEADPSDSARRPASG